jgi:hypothetical protein
MYGWQTKWTRSAATCRKIFILSTKDPSCLIKNHQVFCTRKYDCCLLCTRKILGKSEKTGIGLSPHKNQLRDHKHLAVGTHPRVNRSMQYNVIRNNKKPRYLLIFLHFLWSGTVTFGHIHCSSNYTVAVMRHSKKNYFDSFMYPSIMTWYNFFHNLFIIFYYQIHIFALLVKI